MFRKPKDDEEEKKKVSDSKKADVAGNAVSQNAGPLPTESFEEVIARRFGKPRSALGPGTVIQGKLSFDTPVVIEGKLGGEVYSTETLIVGKSGTVTAQIRVKNLIVAGTIIGSGNIVATDSIELMRGGKIEGDSYAKRVIVEEGSFFNGNCRMGQEPAQLAAQKTEQSAVTSSTAAPTTVKETNMSPEELKRAADMAKAEAAKKLQAQPQTAVQPPRPSGTIAQP